MERIVVIGGVAAGMSAASQAKRLAPSTDVVVLERGPYVSYGACGMPYNIVDPRRSMEDLLVKSVEELRQERGIDVRLRHPVLSVNPAAHTLRVHDLATDQEQELRWDRLVIATGASAIRPRLPGMDLAGVFVLRDLRHGAAIKTYLNERLPKRVAIIGAGYIGLEMVEALHGRGLEIVLLEKKDQLVPGFEQEIVTPLEAALTKRGVEIHTGTTVQGVERLLREGADSLEVRTDHGNHVVDMVLVAVGVRPNVELAQTAGIALGQTGAIASNDRMETSAEGIFAAGDCAEAFHLIAGEPAWIPLGTTANKQGRVAGANAAGSSQTFNGIVGTAAFKVFELEVGRTGLGAADVARLDLDVTRSTSRQASRGHGYPGGSKLTTVVFCERGSGKLVGAQMVGADPVATRIDVFATALHAGMKVDDIAGLDLAYAPPMAPVYDPILIAARVAEKACGRPDDRDDRAGAATHAGGQAR